MWVLALYSLQWLMLVLCSYTDTGTSIVNWGLLRELSNVPQPYIVLRLPYTLTPSSNGGAEERRTTSTLLLRSFVCVKQAVDPVKRSDLSPYLLRYIDTYIDLCITSPHKTGVQPMLLTNQINTNGTSTLP